MRRLLTLLLLGFGWQMAFSQYVSGTATAPSVYTGATMPYNAILHLQNVIFYKASVTKLILAPDCQNVVFDHFTSPDAQITDQGKNDVFQYGTFRSNQEVALQLIGSYGACNYCNASNCTRGFQVGGNHNLVLGCSVTNGGLRSLYGLDDAPYYTANNNQGTNAYNRFIGCTATGTATTWSYYDDNHGSYTTFQGCSGDKPILINGGVYNTLYANHVPGITVLDRQWDVNMDPSVRYVKGNQLLSNNCPVTVSKTLFVWGNTTPRQQWVTVK